MITLSHQRFRLSVDITDHSIPHHPPSQLKAETKRVSMSVSIASTISRRVSPICRSCKSWMGSNMSKASILSQGRIQSTSRSYSLAIENAQLSQLQVPGPSFIGDVTLPRLWNEFTMLIKRTFQPSVIRKRRKTGFLKRQKSVGGRRVLARRLKKGRVRLGGC